MATELPDPRYTALLVAYRIQALPKPGHCSHRFWDCLGHQELNNTTKSRGRQGLSPAGRNEPA